MRAGGTAGRGHRAPRDGPLSGIPAALAALCARNKEQQPEASFALQKREGARKGSVTRQRWAACPVVFGPVTAPETGSASKWHLPGAPWVPARGRWGPWCRHGQICDAGVQPSRQREMPSSEISGIGRGKTPGTFPDEVRFMGCTTGSGPTRCPQLMDLVPADCPGYLFPQDGLLQLRKCLVTLRSSAWRLPPSVRAGGKPSISSLTSHPLLHPNSCPMPRQSPAHTFSRCPRASTPALDLGRD